MLLRVTVPFEINEDTWYSPWLVVFISFWITDALASFSSCWLSSYCQIHVLDESIVHEAGDSSKSSSDNVIRPRFCHPSVKWLCGLTCQTLWQEFSAMRGSGNVCPVSSVFDVVPCFA